MNNPNSTKEPQYNMLFDIKEKFGITELGLMINESWNQDPRRTLFTLSRYKFVSKILEGYKNVLEIGCADAFGTRLVQQTADTVTAVDFDPLFIDDVKRRMNKHWGFHAFVHDIIKNGPIPDMNFDAAYALDVLEHIHPNNEEVFMINILNSILDEGILIIGMPSIESQVYASPQSKIGHVNCKTGQQLKSDMKKYFHTVFVFSMNDEVIHTGFYGMSHYLFAVCSHKKMDFQNE